MNGCPVPDLNPRRITMAHGGGGRMTQNLVNEIFAPAFGMTPQMLHDGAEAGDDGWVMTTDAHVVQPLFFSGGDIGSLAAHGTCNDLAMCGAEPRWLAVSFILEEGLPLDTLSRVAASLARSAAESGARVIAGDTKVVEARGEGGGLFLAVTGAGKRKIERPISAREVEPGDVLLLSGDVGRHGCAVISARDRLAFEGDISSDCGALWPLVRDWVSRGICPRWMRDCTRGGVATVLAELAEESGREIHINEASVPVAETVRGACELLGLDPLYVANEGCFVSCLPADQAERALEILRGHPQGRAAAVIGNIGSEKKSRVVSRQPYGTSRVLDRLAGEQLPRIC